MYIRGVLNSRIFPLFMLSFALGVITAQNLNWIIIASLFVFIFYFAYPAGLLIKGLEQVFEPQNTHSKKGLWFRIVGWNLPLIALFLYDSWPAEMKITLGVFLFLAIFYSAPPIKARSRAFLDVLFSSMFVLPGVFAYTLLESAFPPAMVIAAAALWCMAMYAFTAVPSAAYDDSQGNKTIATALGARGALLFSLVSYIAASYLAFTFLGWFGVAVGGISALVVASTLLTKSPQDKVVVYRLFPYINVLMGLGIFIWIYLAVKNDFLSAILAFIP